MSEDAPKFYFRIEISPLRRSQSIEDRLVEADRRFRETALELAQRLADHGVEDGYEISSPNSRWMKVRALTPQCALLLRCWGEHDTTVGRKQ